MLKNHSDSTHHLLLVLVTCVILLMIFSYFYWTMPAEIMIKMGSYIQTITVFILIITGIITVMTFNQQADDRKRNLSMQYANMTANEINDVEKQFMNNPSLDRLYFEMYAHTPHVQRIMSMREQPRETPEMLKNEQHMSSIIFQKIADIYFCEQLDKNIDNDSIEWINMFHNWMQSPILQSHWKFMRNEHHPDVRAFIDEKLIGSSHKK